MVENHRQADIICGRLCHFSYFGQDFRAFTENRKGVGPDGEIGGGLLEQLSHSKV